MARSLNKKYFGNRNVGTLDPTTDDKIGGEGLANVVFGASVADTSYGSGAYLNKIPHITAIGAPSIPGGVQAVADVLSVKAVHGVVVQSGTPNDIAVQDYRSGDILTVTTGSPTTPAKFTVGALKVSGFTIVSGNSGEITEGYAVGDALDFANGVVLTVATIDGTGGYPANRGVVTSLTLTNAGSYVGSTPPTGTVGQSIPDQVGGRGLTVDFSWGVRDVTVLVAGVYPIVGGSTATTSVTHADLSASTAAGCTLDVYYGVNTITVSQKGSGYKGTETVTFTAADAGLSETRATGTMVLTTDSGAVGSATNQENAIVIRANTSGGGTTAKVGDIIRQVSTRRYKVRTADGIKICQLGTDDTPSPAGAYIVATASNASTYYVTKLTAHKATLVYKSGTQIFDNGTTAPWTFDSTANGRVTIENA